MSEKTNNRPAHHPNGSSSLWLRQLCPYSRKALQTWLDGGNIPRPTEAQLRGTALHLETAEILRGKADPQNAPEEARWAAMAVRHLMEQHSIPVIETEVTLDLPGNRWGTADVIGIGADKVSALLIDFKFGDRPQIAQDNIQLADYATGVADKWGVEVVHAYILQPSDNVSEQVSSWTIDADTMATYRQRIEAICDQTSRVDIEPRRHSSLHLDYEQKDCGGYQHHRASHCEQFVIVHFSSRDCGSRQAVQHLMMVAAALWQAAG